MKVGDKFELVYSDGKYTNTKKANFEVIEVYKNHVLCMTDYYGSMVQQKISFNYGTLIQLGVIKKG